MDFFNFIMNQVLILLLKPFQIFGYTLNLMTILIGVLIINIVFYFLGKIFK